MCLLLQPRLSYTESQVRDLLYLRRLYYGKLGQLYRQRKELRSQVPLACTAEAENICATDNYTVLSDLAEKLRVNAAEEYSVFVQSFCAIFRGVSFQNGLCCPCLSGWAVLCCAVLCCAALFCVKFRGVSFQLCCTMLC